MGDDEDGDEEDDIGLAVEWMPDDDVDDDGVAGAKLALAFPLPVEIGEAATDELGEEADEW